VSAAARNCTSCGQPPLVDVPVIDPLRIAHTMACPLLAAEDATRAADRDRLGPGLTFTRPATTTESTLLAALGWTAPDGQPPTPATRTVVGHFTPGVRMRAWPDLKEPA
jgi:hypothetical protein